MTSPFRTALVPVLIFATGFSVCASAISLGLRAQTPMPEMLVLSPKLEAYRARADKFDTVFIGTSRTFYHIVPDEVEAGAAKAGCPEWNVFNFGVFGLTGAEQDWLTEQVVAIGGGNLKTIVVEDPLANPRDFDEMTTDRARYFLAPSKWAAHVENINSFPESLAKRFFRGGVFGWGVLFDLSGTGRASAVAFPPVGTASFEKDPDFLANDGFEALGSAVNKGILARREAFLANPDRFSTTLAKYGSATNEDVGNRAAYLAKRLEDLQSQGFNAALYISPDLVELDRTPRTGEAVRALPAGFPVLNFNQPDKYPALFERDAWYDFSHLGESGARRLSRMTGEELCAALKPDEAPADVVR